MGGSQAWTLGRLQQEFAEKVLRHLGRLPPRSPPATGPLAVDEAAFAASLTALLGRMDHL
jgi:hypothetical protein